MVFLFILLVLVIISILLINSKIKIDIKEIKFDSRNKSSFKKSSNAIEHKKKENLLKTVNENNINIKIKFVVLGFIPVFWLTINNKKIEKAKQKSNYKDRYKKIFSKFKNSKSNFKSIEILKVIKENLDIEIKNFFLNLSFATEDAVFTSMLVPVISTILTILFYKKQVKQKNQKYQITPLYNSRKFNKC